MPLLFAVPQAASQDRDPLTAAQRLWLKDHQGELTLAFEPDWPPASFYSEEGGAQGISPEYVALIEAKLGFRFRRIRYATWADMLQAIYKGEVDVIPTMARIPERAAHLNFSSSYFQVPTSIVTGPGVTGVLNLTAMEGKRVCVLRGSADQQILSRRHPGIELVPVDYTLDGLKMVSFGEADGLVADIGVTSYLMEKHGLSQLQSAGYTNYSYEICMGIAKDQPMLVEILNRGMALITPPERREIFKKWLFLKTRPFYRDPSFRAYVVTCFLAFGGVLVVMFLGWTRSLRRAVARATRVSREAEESLRAQAVELEGARQRVARANLELTQVFNASTPMLIIDREFSLLHMNRTFGELFGVDPSTISGQQCHEVIHSTLCRTDACPLKQALAGNSPRRSERIFSSSSRDGLPCLVAANTLKDESGRLVGIVESFTDISRLLQAEEEKEQLQAQLRHSQKIEALGTLAGGIAHDFNNILSPIIGYAEMTQYSLPPESVEAENMTGILKAAQRARNLVRQILTLSRRHRTELKPVHVQSVVTEALTLLRSTLPSTIVIKQALQAEGRLICGDPTHVHQIIMNLCTNAYHAMEGQGGGILEVILDRVCAPDGEASGEGLSAGAILRIQVRDTGVGIDAAHRDRIFDPYFTTKGEGKGTGLGLSVVHGIVRESGGTISVDSYPGLGSTFTLCFPEVTGEESAPDPVPLGDPPTGRESLLVVDDEEEVVFLLKRMLSRAGYRVTVATESRDALSLFQADPDAFDLVVSDMTMPGMIGYDLARQIRECSPGTPVILCTGYNDRVVREKAEKIGVKVFLVKPVEMRTLLDAVRQELDGARRPAEPSHTPADGPGAVVGGN